MTVHVDTSALVDALTGSRRSLDALIGLAEEGHRLSISAIVLYEWLRGPRTRAELAVQEDLFPAGTGRAVRRGTGRSCRAALRRSQVAEGPRNRPGGRRVRAARRRRAVDAPARGFSRSSRSRADLIAIARAGAAPERRAGLCYLPALRATRVGPLLGDRSECGARRHAPDSLIAIVAC